MTFTRANTACINLKLKQLIHWIQASIQYNLYLINYTSRWKLYLFFICSVKICCIYIKYSPRDFYLRWKTLWVKWLQKSCFKRFFILQIKKRFQCLLTKGWVGDCCQVLYNAASPGEEGREPICNTSTEMLCLKIEVIPVD